MSSLPAAYALWLFGGIFGLHQLYLGNRARAALYACTAGVCGLGYMADLCTLPRQVARANAGGATATKGATLVSFRTLGVLLVLLFASRLFTMVAASWVLLDVDDAREIEEWPLRAAAACAIATAAAAGAVLTVSAFGFRTPSAGATVLLTAVATCGATFVSELAAASGAAVPAEPMATTSVACYAAAAAALGGAWWGGRVGASAPPAASTHEGDGCCHRTGAGCCSLLSLFAAVACFWGAALAGALLQAPVSVRPADLRFDPMSVHTVRFGAFLWHHRARIVREAGTAAAWLRREWADKGAAQVLEELLAAAAAALDVSSARHARELELLGLPTAGGGADVTAADVRRAYHALARVHHPDALPPAASEAERLHAAERFRRVHAAYETLLAARGRRDRWRGGDGEGG